VGAACLGLKTGWVSRLPDTALGRLVRNKARECGVDTSSVVWVATGRVGLYFCEFGAAPRPSAIMYDRAGSAISQIEPNEVEWAEVLAGVRWFHVTGVTPALSKGAAAATADALAAAHAAGCHVSYDLNYRAKLWSETDARAFTEPVMRHVDTLITTEEDTQRVLGVQADAYPRVAEVLQDRFDLDTVVITLRENLSVWRNNWTAIARSAGRLLETRTYEVEIVDRVGAGDSFCAGYIYGMLANDDQQYALDLGGAFSAIKHSVPGDMNVCTLEEAERLMKGSGLRINR
jgi:2-dehydro-3-deoxygluconokinase